METLQKARVSYSASGAEYDAARCLTAEAAVMRESGEPGADARAKRLEEEARFAYEKVGAAGVED
jgi:hypothetical protein